MRTTAVRSSQIASKTKLSLIEVGKLLHKEVSKGELLNK